MKTYIVTVTYANGKQLSAKAEAQKVSDAIRCAFPGLAESRLEIKKVDVKEVK